MFRGLQGLHVPSGNGKVDVRIDPVIVAVSPSSVGALGIQNPVHSLHDDPFQIGDGGNVHLLAERVRFAEGVGGYGVVVADLVSLRNEGKNGSLHALVNEEGNSLEHILSELFGKRGFTVGQVGQQGEPRHGTFVIMGSAAPGAVLVLAGQKEIRRPAYGLVQRFPGGGLHVRNLFNGNGVSFFPAFRRHRCAKRRAGTQNGEEKDGLIHARKRDQAC